MTPATHISDKNALLLTGVQPHLPVGLSHALTTLGATVCTGDTPVEGDMSLAAINTQVLQAAGHDVWRADTVQKSWFDTEAAHGLMQGLPAPYFTQAQVGSVLALAEPQLARLVPFWRNALEGQGYALSAMNILQAPDVTCATLQSTLNCRQEDAQILWLHYMLNVEQDTRDMPRYYVQPLIGQPIAETLSHVSQRLNFAWPHGIEAAPDLGLWAAPDHAETPSDPTSDRTALSLLLTEWVDAAYSIFYHWTVHPERPQDHAKLDQLAQKFRSNMAQISHDGGAQEAALGMVTETQSLRDQVAALEGNQHQLTLQRNANAALQEQLNEALDEISVFDATQRKNAQHIETLGLKLQTQEQAAETQISSVQSDLSVLQDKYDTQERDLQDSDETLRQTRSALEQRRHEVEDAHRQLQDANDARLQAEADHDTSLAKVNLLSVQLTSTKSKLGDVTAQASARMTRDLSHALEGTDRKALTAKLTEENKRRGELETQLRTAHDATAELQTQLDATHVAKVELEAQLQERTAAADTIRTELEGAQHTLVAKEHQITAFYNSTSWRITRPIRGLGQLIKRVSKK